MTEKLNFESDKAEFSESQKELLGAAPAEIIKDEIDNPTRPIEEDKDKLSTVREQIKGIVEEQKSEEKPRDLGEYHEKEWPKGKNKLVRTAERVFSKICRLKVEGADNLEDIPKYRRVIFATTHISDQDVSIVLGALGKLSKEYPRLGQAHVAQQKQNFEDPFMMSVIKMTGVENSLSIDSTGAGSERKGKFNTGDYDVMGRVLDEGIPLVHAAYLDPNSDGDTLSPMAGNGVTYLASKAPEETLIVPVAVNMKAKMPMQQSLVKQALTAMKFFGRPKTTVAFGQPYEIRGNFNPKDVETVLLKRQKGEKIAPAEMEKFKTAKEAWQESSEDLMFRLSSLLPEKKRGVWVEKRKKRYGVQPQEG
jgi:hypothetical protein